MLRKQYRYVGPSHLLDRVTDHAGWAVQSLADLKTWVEEHADSTECRIWATYVVDTDGVLRIATRQSEHVGCACGGNVLAAGEICFDPDCGITEISNLSTGYCPEPVCWQAVDSALTDASLPHPARFTQEVTFRRCEKCNERNVIKDDWFVCAVCGAALPSEWNFDG